ncbi:DNA-3-methyladenine glycosylase [Alkalihalobacillus sp. AL-G]|uniref:DNA-3-methyladenine glycosylase family protein n=1 Tax=Alkalihalobacillus sp. AL-G TaxID=2926399 RepID=UPI00272A5486|nr:DNA-3-methyladenine glycosylase [Alkalihalobacillus sp. AL-G]WLD94171.1 DNA-3-methyladenine glycosylase [Alkalihalobacillus sp. AL-G]
MNKTYLEIMFDGPFSFELTFQQHHRTTETLQSMVVIPDKRRFVKWIHIDGKPFLLDAVVQIEGERVTIFVNDSGLETVDDKKLVSVYFTRMFGLSNSLSDFYKSFGNNDVVKQLIDQFYGMRVVTNPDLFETVIDTIIGQQVNLKFAATLKERLVRLAGEIRPVEGCDLYLFPTADFLAQLDYEQLRELSFSQRKAEYIIDFSRLVTSKSLDLDRLWEASNEEIIKQLLPIRGIGLWTIECLMLFGLHRKDVLPAADIGVRNAVRKIYSLEHQPSDDEVRTIAFDGGWNPWESYITYYLWQYLKK